MAVEGKRLDFGEIGCICDWDFSEASIKLFQGPVQLLQMVGGLGSILKLGATA